MPTSTEKSTTSAALRSPSFAGLRPASEAASRAKQANRKRDSLPERLLRRALWRLGQRYRKYGKALPGNPDLVFSGPRVVVFCDGDFWHGRQWTILKEKLRRGTNAPYWLAKIARNRQRDCDNTAALEQDGWLVLRLWETDIKKNPLAAAQLIQQAVWSRTCSQSK